MATTNGTFDYDEPLTQDELAELDPDERKAYLDQRKQELRAAVDDEVRDLAESEAQARDALLAAAEAEIETETVTLGGGVELEVRCELPGAAERRLTQISQHSSVADALEDILFVLCGAPDTKPGDADYRGLIIAPPEYATRAAWRDVYEQHGSKRLQQWFGRLQQPALDRMEAVDSFRDE